MKRDDGKTVQDSREEVGISEATTNYSLFSRELFLKHLRTLGAAENNARDARLFLVGKKVTLSHRLLDTY